PRHREPAVHGRRNSRCPECREGAGCNKGNTLALPPPPGDEEDGQKQERRRRNGVRHEADFRWLQELHLRSLEIVAGICEPASFAYIFRGRATPDFRCLDDTSGPSKRLI